jgi:hypothetical protein
LQTMFLRRCLDVQAQAEFGRRGRHTTGEYGIALDRLVVAMAPKASPGRPGVGKESVRQRAGGAEKESAHARGGREEKAAPVPPASAPAGRATPAAHPCCCAPSSAALLCALPCCAPFPCCFPAFKIQIPGSGAVLVFQIPGIACVNRSPAVKVLKDFLMI